MKYFITIILLGFILSCRVGTGEVDAVWKNQVFNHYGGECTLGTAIYKEGKEKYYKIELSRSENIKYFTRNYEIPASNIASILYDNLRDPKSEELSINVKINLGNEPPHESIYTKNELEKIKEFIPFFESFVTKIKDKDYESIVKDMNSKLPVEHVKTLCDLNNTIYGKIKETQFQGFSFINKEADDKSFVKLVGVNIRALRNTPFVVVIDEETKVVDGFVFEM